MKSSSRAGILLAVLAAALYALNAPLSKLLLARIPATLMAGLLYVGAGIGMGGVALVRFVLGRHQRARSGHGDETVPTTHAEHFRRADLPYVLLMIALDVVAPILLMLGLSRTSAAGASLLNNFEIVATALIALLVFREVISPRLWGGIALVTLACMLLSVEPGTDLGATLRPSVGALLVLGASLAWGIENNCTRRLSGKDPLIIVLLKGVFSGGTSVVIGLSLGERIDTAVLPSVLPAVLLVGFVAYGLSIFCYVYAQRMLGAARTGAYYAIAPFIGTALSLILFRDPPPVTYYAALAFMALGVYLSSSDRPLFRKEKRAGNHDRR